MHGSFFFLYVQEVMFSLKPDHPDILSIYVYLSLFITISLFISKSLTGKFQGDRNGDLTGKRVKKILFMNMSSLLYTIHYGKITCIFYKRKQNPCGPWIKKCLTVSCRT